MYSYFTKLLSSRYFYKKSGAALAGALCVLAIAGCNASQNAVQIKPTAYTNVAYSIPAQSIKSAQSKADKAVRIPATTATKQSKPAAKVSAVTYVGRAPHICTPSGFGSKPRCFLRT